MGANVNGRYRKENGDGVASRTMQEKEPSYDRVEEVDEIEVVIRKASVKIACPFCRVLLGVLVVVLTSDPHRVNPYL